MTPAKSARHTPKPSSKSFPSTFLQGALLIVIVTFIAFAPALSAGFIWDDNDMLTENHLIQAKDGIARIWKGEFVDYFPLTMTSLWIEWRLWGMHATGYHVTNVVLHALSALLLWQILKRIAVPGAFWAALLFAVHPVNVESVAWITERKNTLCFFLAALATLFFHTSIQKRSLGSVEWKRWYVFALISFTLSLMAKTATVMLPFVFLGIALWENRTKIKSAPAIVKQAVPVAPFFAIAGALSFVTIWFQYNRAIEHVVVNSSSLPERFIIAGRAIWFYLVKALLPINLTFVYPRWSVESGQLLQFLPLLCVVLLLVALFLARKRVGYGPLIGFGYFVVTLFPVLGFFNIYFQRYSFVADHWQYVSIIGILAVVSAGLHLLLRDKAPIALGCVCAVFAVLSFQQSKIYKNQETLWVDTLKKNPKCAMAEANWGLHLYNERRPDEAIRHYEAALQLNPADDGTIYNWGVILLERGQASEAAAKFEQTLKLNPRHKSALLSLAWVRAINKDPLIRNGAQAVQLAEQGVQLTKGDDEWMLDTLAAAYAEVGRFGEAIKSETKAIETAQRKNLPDLANDMKSRLALYQSGMPFREK